MNSHNRSKYGSKIGSKSIKSYGFRSSHLVLAFLLAYAAWFIFCTVQLNNLIPLTPSSHQSDGFLSQGKSSIKVNIEDGKSSAKSETRSLDQNNANNSEWVYDKQHLSLTDDGSPLQLTAMLEKPVDSWFDILRDDPITPRDTAKRDLLVEIKYGDAESCIDFPSRLPVDSIRYENVQQKMPLLLDRELLLEQAEHCPSDADPFLPWIHDIIPSHDGKTIGFVAQNKRMCNTGLVYLKEAERMESQVALLQPVSVKRVKDKIDGTVRYKITDRKDADDDGKETRFICVFHGTGKNAEVYYETLSRYPFNYEMVSHRKGERSMSTRDGLDKGQFWLSTVLFDCPVPEPLQALVSDGSFVQNDGSSLFVDLVPIRTPLRMHQW